MDDNLSKDSLGFVGLGVMGRHMCRNLAEKSQQRIYAFDSSEEALLQCSANNMQICSSLVEIAESSNIVFLSLPHSDAVKEVCLGEKGLCSGIALPEVIVDMGTTDVEMTHMLGKELSERGVKYVDAPVARMPEAARDGTLLIMVGASEGDFDRLVPYLSLMGSDVVRCGGLGAGQIVKILNNFVLISNVNVLAEALLIGERMGVSGNLLFNTLLLGSGSSEALKFAGVNGLVPRNFPAGRFSAKYALKDITLAACLGRETGVNATILDTVENRLRRAVDNGSGDSYYPVIVQEIDINS